MMQRLIAGILAPIITLAGFYLWGRTHPYTVSRSIQIAASPERVWSVLSDLRSYAAWNPQLTVMSGRATAGAALTVRVRSAHGTGTLHPIVEVAEPGRELRWSERFRDVSHLADSEHRFTIEPDGQKGVRFTQAQTFHGVAVPFIHGTLRDGCAEFEAMNAALKKRAESGK